MGTVKILTVDFVGAAIQPGAYPKLTLPEIAFSGRSNVGKSSLINRLLDQKIARTSNKPGRTRQLNFFTINNALTFVDLPGYGYAKVAKSERKGWKHLIEDYLVYATNLSGVVIVIDIRRGPEKEEDALCEFLAHHNRPFLLVATKCDKLKRNQREKRRKILAERIDPDPLLLFSSQTGSGKDELWHQLHAWTAGDPGAQAGAGISDA